MNSDLDTATVGVAQADFAAASQEAIDGLAGFLRARLKTSNLLILKETEPGLVRGSWRSDGDGLMLAEYFGGGGHRHACGFGLKARILVDGARWQVV